MGTGTVTDTGTSITTTMARFDPGAPGMYGNVRLPVQRTCNPERAVESSALHGTH